MTERTLAAPPCCRDGATGSAGVDAPIVALVGAPNGGKSTLFNTVTGAKRTVGNWPGTTVEVGSGVWRDRSDEGPDLTLLDLPGAYSLDPISPDEALTRALLCDVPPADVPDAVIVTVDAANMARGLYLVAQLREQPVRIIVALTMLDIAARRGISIDVPAFAAAIGVPVVALDPRERHGHEDLESLVRQVLAEPPPAPRVVGDLADFGGNQEVDDLGGTQGQADLGGTQGQGDLGGTQGQGDRGQGQGHGAAVSDEDARLAAADERFAWIAAAALASADHGGQQRVRGSDRLDRWVCAPVIGPLIFLVAMWLVFQITTTVAAPLQDALDRLVSGPLTSGARAVLGAISLGESPIGDFITNGLIAGVGMLLTFVPLMALMFLLLALLEDSGYMARAAVVTDRTMRRLGLPGRAFLPLVVGFGCNVPAITATRILGQARQRVLTALLVPFTSCTARLTVYVMLASVFFPGYAGTVAFAMYVTSILLVLVVGFALRKTLWRTMGADPLVLDLPPYQVPKARLLLSVMWLRLKGFLHTASGIIVATVAVVWLLQATPVDGEARFGEVAVADSAYGLAAQAITPAFVPTGFAQWETTSALVVGFVAKEAVISSWAQTFAVADAHHDDPTSALAPRLRAAFATSSHGHTGPAVAAFMIFLLAYTPCVATLAAQRKEVGLRWTAFGIGMQLVVAWTLAVAVFQIGRLIW